VALAISSTLLVGPVTRRFGKSTVVTTALIAMGLCALLFVATDVPAVSYAAIFVAFLFFGVTYPILLGLFSASVGPDHQGWIMGVATAEFTLLIGIISMLGGDLMGLDIRLPFFIAAGSAVLGLAAQAAVWRQPAFRKAVQLES
jgi:predicted MFS family arabinose efflux permease